MMKTIAVLGVVGTIFAATATPTLARTTHHDGAYGAYGQVVTPRAMRGPLMRAPLIREPHGFGSRSEAWDPYGMRWDGGN